MFSSLRKAASDFAPHASMIYAQFASGGYIVLSQVMLDDGASSTVYLVYQFIIITVFMTVLALIFERKERPTLTFSILCRIFGLAFVGLTLATNLLAAGLYFVSGTVETAVLNMLPVITFSISIMSQQEKLGIKTSWGQGKLLGTLLSVIGALTVVLWKGSPSIDPLKMSSTYWFLGTLLVILGVLASSSWILMLRPVVTVYPAVMSMNAIMSFFATLQGAAVAAITGHKPSEWRLSWNLELLNIFIGGILYNGLANLFVTWCVAKKGPIFVASFSPLAVVFATFLGVVFLGDALHIGSVVGAVVIVMGLYIFLWSKAKEEDCCSINDENPLDSPFISNSAP
ncbi:WAT1-related protein At3g30340-like [Aristolochia californica]|uniref:WAT1-related protein At3g30340-like n=1 Tax=Aristolochia californica TaxID=171875 RepID=UPI0035D70B30